MSTLKGIAAAAWIALNTLVLGTALIGVAAVRAVIPSPHHSDAISAFMDRFVDRWVRNNRHVFRALALTSTHVDWQSPPIAGRDAWYLVVSNHQTWSDILVLQDALLDRVPPLKFFVKRELLWLPVAGFCMWLLDFPFLRRFGAEQLARDPALADVDRRATAAACERFRRHPTSVLIFLEGSRFTAEKHRVQNSPYRHLLTPKAGGFAYVLDGLGPSIARVIDVTLLYPDGVPTFWDFLCGRCRRVDVTIRHLPVPAGLIAAAGRLDDGGRAEVRTWLAELWQSKDTLIHERLASDLRDHAPARSHV